MITSAEEFVTLRASRMKAEYDRSAMEEAPFAVWREVIKAYPDYVQWVIHNKTVPLEILEELCASHPDSRYFIARKRKLSLEMFVYLSQDSDPMVRSGIALNQKTPLEIVERLCCDEDEDVADTAKRHYKARRNAVMDK